MSTLNGISDLSMSLTTVMEEAAHWFIQSGIQISSNDPRLNGGYASWYEQDTESSPYVYSEITGYMLTMLCTLWERTGNTLYLNSAIRAGEWFIETVNEPTGGFRCLYPLYSTRFDYKNNQIYTFDCGVILNGLMCLHRITKQPSYLASAVTMADWLVNVAQKPSGAFSPVYNIEKQEFSESDTEWSLCAGSYHSKIAIGLLNLYDLTRKAKYRNAAIKGCDFALTFQQPDGRFVSFPTQGGTNSHPHAYSAEGLWVAGTYLGREDYLYASAKATQWLLNLQSPEGIIPRHYHHGEALYHERVDVLSQTLRLAVIHLAEKRLPQELQHNINALLPAILRNQARTDDKRTGGAFYFGRLSNGEIMPHANVWVTAFALQALMLYHDYQQGSLKFNPFHFV